MAMLMCCLSFLIYFGGKNASYNGQKNYESLDVQRQCAHIFALVINYLNDLLIYATMGLFEIHESMGLSMARQL